MHSFHQETSAIIEILQYAHDQVEAITNPEIALLKARIQGDLKRHINSLSTQLGIPVDDKNFKPVKTTPIRKIMGRVISSIPIDKTTVPVQRKTAQQVEFEELQQKVSEIYPKFLSSPADDLLDSCSDMEIRGVAKKAGMPVTETNPKTITTAYIEEIKKAIQSKITIAGAGKPNDVSDTGTDDLPYIFPYVITEKDLEQNEHFAYAQLLPGETIYLNVDPATLQEGSIISDFQTVATGGEIVEEEEETSSNDTLKNVPVNEILQRKTAGDPTTKDGQKIIFVTNEGNPELAALEAQLQQLKDEGAHHMKIKAVEKQIAELKAAPQNEGNHQ